MNPSKIANTFAGERQMIYSNKTISNHIDYLFGRYQVCGLRLCDAGGECQQEETPRHHRLRTIHLQ